VKTPKRRKTPEPETPQERIRAAEETLDAVRSIQSDPTSDDVARLHEVHAKHERRHGHDERADEAEQRAARARRKS
jgi:hypothetical protein